MEDTLGRARRAADLTWRHLRTPLYRNAFLIMLSSVIAQGLGFLFWLIVARYYAAADVGYAVALFQTLSFIATLATMGLGIGIIRYLPETANKTALVNTAATICGIAAMILALAFISTVSFISPSLAFILEDPIYIVAIFITTLALTLPTIYDQTSFAVRRAEVMTWRIVIFSIAKLPLAVGFASMSYMEGRIGVFLALAVASAVAVMVEMFYLLPRVLSDFKPRLRFSFCQIRPMLGFSIGNYSAGSIAAAGGLLLPVLILNVLGSGGAEDVAYYYIATVVAGLLNIIPIGVFTSFYAEASQKNSNRSVDERRAILLSIALLVPGIAGLWLFSEEMLMWFGSPTYVTGAVDALRILILGSLPLFVNSALMTRIRIRKRSAPLVIGAVISTATILALGVILLHVYGISGLAIASVIGAGAATPYYYLAARESFNEGHNTSTGFHSDGEI